MSYSRKNLLTLLSSMLVLTLLSAGSVRAGEGYERLAQPQPTADPSKIEVIEIFWYGCPHCHDFEPYLNEWLKTKPEDVDFKRMPAVFRQNWLAHAKAYYTAVELGVLDKIHSAMFAAIHEQGQRLDNEEDLKAFFVAHGVDAEAFSETYNSQSVESHIKRSLAMLRRYEVTGVPSLIIDGKYKTSGPLAGTYTGMIDVLNELIAREREAKKATSQ